MVLRRWEYGWRAEQRRRMCQHFYKVRYCNFYVRSSIHEAIIKQVAKKNNLYLILMVKGLLTHLAANGGGQPTLKMASALITSLHLSMFNRFE